MAFIKNNISWLDISIIFPVSRFPTSRDVHTSYMGVILCSLIWICTCTFVISKVDGTQFRFKRTDSMELASRHK